jgi:membrane-bound lytic murein transglycosylase B
MEEKIHMKTDLLLILTVAALVVCLVSISFSAENRPDFQVWLAELRTEALAKGISKSTLDEAFRGLEPIPRVIELDRDQPEFTLTLQKYLNRVAENWQRIGLFWQGFMDALGCSQGFSLPFGGWKQTSVN